MLRPLLSAAALLAAATPTFAQPAQPATATLVPAVVELSALNPAEYDALAARPTITLLGLPLDGRPDGVPLDRFDIFAADAELAVVTAAGSRPMPRPSLALFRSRAADPAARVVLGISPAGVYGVLRTPAEEWIISTGPAYSGQPLTVARRAAFDGPLPVPGPWCPVEGDDWRLDVENPPPAGETGFGGACSQLRVAVETDNEFLSSLFAGDENAAAAYVGTLFAAVGQIYTWDLNVTFEVSFLRLWAAPDPWDRTSTGSQLGQFREYWLANQQSTPRGVAHYLSGRGLGGGVAYLSALCSMNSGYGLSANLSGSFPYPIQDNHGANWDLMVVSHELGHNFGAPHTHSMSPPVDCCGGAYGGNCGGTQDCTGANTGTIMSYCHICPGGMSNVRLEFHSRTLGEAMLPYIATRTCFVALPLTVTDHPDSTSRPVGAAASFEVAADSAAEIAYQWRRDGENVYDDARFSGTATPALTIDPVAVGDAGLYDCVLLSICDVVASNVATLTVTPAEGCPDARGDANCDGTVDFFDIDPFLAALFDPPAYATAYCGGSICSVDADCSGLIDFFDIDPLLECLFAECPNCP